MKYYLFLGLLLLTLSFPLAGIGQETITPSDIPQAEEEGDDSSQEFNSEAQPAPNGGLVAPDTERETRFYRARITQIEEEVIDELPNQDRGGREIVRLNITAQILEGTRDGQIIELDHGGGLSSQEQEHYQAGTEIIVGRTSGGNAQFYLHDTYRLPGLFWIAAIFVGLTLVFARLRGLGALVGLFLSITILFSYIIPQLIRGGDPMWVTLSGTMMIIVVGQVISHGPRIRTGVSLLSTVVLLSLVYGLSVLFLYLGQMFGGGSEEAFHLQYAVNVTTGVDLDLQGLLLGGILIGMLGVLDDVTIGQAATIDEVKRVKPDSSFRELFRSGMSVGRDHVASVVNSLALAYVGASLPLFLLLYVNMANIPWWVTLNSEFLAQEIVRTLAGSTAIVLAVPITTVIAAFIYSNIHVEPSSESEVSHGHHH